jgi:glyoxylase-like metal-dependent hydrolase (beta-lactamase superfamily II)
MEILKFGDITLHWLNGGDTHLDGGAMFGVVPKALWSKKYTVNERNQVQLRTDPIFFQYQGKNILIESGIGNGKLNEKQMRNYGVTEESKVEESLRAFNLQPKDIDIILMTHLHFDHACGLTKQVGDKQVSVFENATIYVSDIEWEEMRNPNIRSRNTYWTQNWNGIENQIQTFSETITILPGIEMIHTGGHSNGHSVIKMQQGDDFLIHMGDIMPTQAHQNVLWVLAFDDYPMDSIAQKQKWMEMGLQKNAWYTFYHDADYRAIKWNEKGEVIDSVLRVK